MQGNADCLDRKHCQKYKVLDRTDKPFFSSPANIQFIVILAVTCSFHGFNFGI